MEVGTRLGHYEIIGPLGSGAMGEVYRAHDTNLKREVAVKLLPDEVATDSERLARLEREAHLLAGLSHPNIAAIYSLETVGDTRMLVLELVEGPTLADRLAEGPLPMPEVLKIAEQIADALAEAHAKGVIHRDLKPANIKITPDGTVKVLDFGLAKTLVGPGLGEEASRSPTLTVVGTQLGMILGTIPYMSPEQARGQAVDARTDVWAFGCVVYEMATGVRPFDGHTAADIMAAILEREPDWKALPEAALPRLGSLLGRCLSKDVPDRLRDIGDARIEIREMVDVGRASDAAAHDSRAHAETAARSRVALWTTVAAVVLGLVTVLLVLDTGDIRTRLTRADGVLATIDIQSVAVLPFDDLSADASNEEATAALSVGLVMELGSALSPRKVSAWESVRLIKEQDLPLPEVSRLLGVDGVVTGQVVYSGDQVMIAVTLYHGATETPLWSNDYQRPRGDYLALIGETTLAIAAQVGVALTPLQQARLSDASPVSPDAEEAYLRGRYFLDQRDPLLVDTAADYLARAIDLDPLLARAHAGLAKAHYQWAAYFQRPAQEVYPLAKGELMAALAIDPDLAEVWEALGWVAAHGEWDWTAAEEAYRRSISLNEGYAEAHKSYGQFLVYTGRTEDGLAELYRAIEIDPLSKAVRHNLALGLHIAGRNDEAIKEYLKVLDLDPNYFPAQVQLGLAYSEGSMHQEAIAQGLAALELVPGGNAMAMATLGMSYGRAGQPSAALRTIRELQQLAAGTYVDPGLVALVYASLSDRDEAMEWLEVAYRQRSEALMYLLLPALDGLRTDPRFQDLLGRMNFPQ